MTVLDRGEIGAVRPRTPNHRISRSEHHRITTLRRETSIVLEQLIRWFGVRGRTAPISPAVENSHPFVIDPMSWKENEGLQEMVFTGVPQACEDIETDPRISKALRRYFRSNGTKSFSPFQR